MNRDGWRVLVKGLSVVAGVAALVASLFWVIGANVLEGYQSDASAAWALVAIFGLAGTALCAWPWLFWKPTKLDDKP